MLKKYFHVLLPIFVVLVSVLCAKDVKKDKQPEVDATTHSSEKENNMSLEEGNLKFSFDLYSKLKSKEGNIFLSPYSVSSALAMTYAGAKNNTEQQMASSLSFPKEQNIVHEGFFKIDQIISEINKKGDVSLSVANSIWPSNTYALIDKYVNLLKKEYRVSVTPQDYSKNAEKARININSWVEEKTNKKIVELIGKGVLDKLTKLVLVNAIYFKGDWKHQFNKKSTRETDFYSGENSTKVQMMNIKAKYRYAEDNHVQIIELPYKEEKLSMMVVLPKNRDSLTNVENSLNSEIINVWDKAMLKKEVNLALPKFKIEWGTEALDGPLKELGMVDAFSANADFTGMTKKKDLYIKTVLHKAFIEVNEEGSEAAAATAVVMARASIDGPRPIYFVADHPFLFFIREKSTGTILFMGRVVNPI